MIPTFWGHTCWRGEWFLPFFSIKSREVLTAPPEVYRYSGSRLCNSQLGSPKPPRAGSEPLTANEPSHGDLNASRGFQGTGGPWVGFPRSKPQDKGWRASRLFGSYRKSWSGSEEVTQGRGGGPERVSHHTGETSRCKSAHEHGNPKGQGLGHQQHVLLRKERARAQGAQRDSHLPLPPPPVWPCGQGTVMATLSASVSPTQVNSTGSHLPSMVTEPGGGGTEHGREPGAEVGRREEAGGGAAPTLGQS